jgi:hypothetical protein
MKKIIEIQNYNDPTELKKLISLLQNRRKNILRSLGYDQINFNGSKYNSSTILPAMEEMYKLDNCTTGNYYVYAHCNPLKPLSITTNLKHLFLASMFPSIKYEPFYIGKGVGNRAYELSRNDSHRKIRSSIIKYKKDIEVCILDKNLSEDSALAKESKLIDILGLISLSKHGLLANIDEGADASYRREQYKLADNAALIAKILVKNGYKSI